MFTEFITTGPHSYYFPASIEVAAGEVTFELTNQAPAGTFHNMNIGTSVGGTPLASSSTVPSGESRLFVVQSLPAGSYVVWCSIENHAQEGMVGTLTVTP